MVRHNARLSSIAAHVVPAAAGTEVEALTKILTNDTMNEKLMEMEYAVRGELVIKAGQYQLRSFDILVSGQLGSSSLGALIGFAWESCAGWPSLLLSERSAGAGTRRCWLPAPRACRSTR